MAAKNFTMQERKNKILILTLLTAIFATGNSLAAKKIEETNYFASLRASETNVRSGPGQNYPVKFTFKLRALPIKVISQYDNWSEIEDFQGQSGWVMQSLTSKKRTLIVQTTKEFATLRNKPNDKGRVILELENNVVGDYLKCENSWCAMKIAGKKGWIKASEVFGD